MILSIPGTAEVAHLEESVAAATRLVAAPCGSPGIPLRADNFENWARGGLPSGMADIFPSLPPRADNNGQGAPASRRPAAPSREPLWRHVLGEHLRSLRHERGETLVETSGRAGVSPTYLSEMERGIKEPSSEMIAAVAGALGTTLVDLTLGVAENLRSTRPAGRSGAVCRAAYALAV